MLKFNIMYYLGSAVCSQPQSIKRNHCIHWAHVLCAPLNYFAPNGPKIYWFHAVFFKKFWQIRMLPFSEISHRCGSRIWSRGAPDSEAKSCWAELHEWRELSVAGVQGPIKGPGSFQVFNAQICIIPHSRDSLSLIFDIYFNTKTDKNRMLDCTSNNLRYSYLLHLVAKLCETKTKNKDF